MPQSSGLKRLEKLVARRADATLLGWLFKNHRSQQQLTDLYFFVTPTLL